MVSVIIRKENQILLQISSKSENKEIYELPNYKSVDHKNEISLLEEEYKKLRIEFEATTVFFKANLEECNNVIYNTRLYLYQDSYINDQVVWIEENELKNLKFTKEFKEVIDKLIYENDKVYSFVSKVKKVIEKTSEELEMKINYNNGYNYFNVFVYNACGMYCPYIFSMYYIFEEDSIRLVNSIKITRMYAEGDKSDLYFIFANLMAIIYKCLLNKEVYINYINIFDEIEINGSEIILKDIYVNNSSEKMLQTVQYLYDMYTCSLMLFDLFIGSFSLIREDKKIIARYVEYLDNNEDFNMFSREEHQYYTNYKKRISLINIDNSIYNIKKFKDNHDWNIIDGIDGKILHQVDNEYESYNFVSYEDWNRVLRVINDMDIKNYSIICNTNHLYLLEKNRIWIFQGDFNEYWVEREKEKMLQRQSVENRILHLNRTFKWKYPVNSGRFEELVADLLETDIRIDRVRLVGKSNNPDGGRDLIIYKLRRDNEGKYIQKLIIGQCKAYKKSVNKSHILDIRDTLEHYNAEGFFVAVTSSITAPLIDHLCKLKEKKDVDWWTEREIFKKLRQNSYILDKYLDIIEVMD